MACLSRKCLARKSGQAVTVLCEIMFVHSTTLCGSNCHVGGRRRTCICKQWMSAECWKTEPFQREGACKWNLVSKGLMYTCPTSGPPQLTLNQTSINVYQRLGSSRVPPMLNKDQYFTKFCSFKEFLKQSQRSGTPPELHSLHTKAPGTAQLLFTSMPCI